MKYQDALHRLVEDYRYRQTVHFSLASSVSPLAVAAWLVATGNDSFVRPLGHPDNGISYTFDALPLEVDMGREISIAFPDVEVTAINCYESRVTSDRYTRRTVKDEWRNGRSRTVLTVDATVPLDALRVDGRDHAIAFEVLKDEIEAGDAMHLNDLHSEESIAPTEQTQDSDEDS